MPEKKCVTVKILVVDDHCDLTREVAAQVEEINKYSRITGIKIIIDDVCNNLCQSSSEERMSSKDLSEYDAVIIDLFLDTLYGADMVERVKAADDSIYIVLATSKKVAMPTDKEIEKCMDDEFTEDSKDVMSRIDSTKMLLESVAAGCDDFVTRGSFTPEALLKIAIYAMEKSEKKEKRSKIINDIKKMKMEHLE